MAGIFGTEQREKLEKTILSYPSIDNALSFLEKKTQVKKVYILYGTIISLYFKLYVFFNYELSEFSHLLQPVFHQLCTAE